jgi:hypothetical protein
MSASEHDILFAVSALPIPKSPSGMPYTDLASRRPSAVDHARRK